MSEKFKFRTTCSWCTISHGLSQFLQVNNNVSVVKARAFEHFIANEAGHVCKRKFISTGIGFNKQHENCFCIKRSKFSFVIRSQNFNEWCVLLSVQIKMSVHSIRYSVFSWFLFCAKDTYCHALHGNTNTHGTARATMMLNSKFLCLPSICC